jgi:hypothetical protein
MAKNPETLFKEKCFRDLASILHAGGRLWWVKIQLMAVCGIPDILMCVNGTFVAIELKKDAKSRPTKLQSHVLGLIKRAGGHATVESPESWPTTLEAIKVLAFGHTEDSH